MIAGVDTGEAIAFGIVSLVLVSSALASSMVKRTFHAVMFLGVALVAVAALFIVIGSPLIGVVQILVYVGGILTLFIFAVMFVAGDEQEAAPYAAPPRNSVWGILAGIVAAVGALVVAFTLVGPVYWTTYGLVGSLGIQGDLARIPAFIAGTLVFVAAAIAAIVAWMGIRHVLYRWSATRILGAVVGVAIMGLVVSVALDTGAWDVGGTAASAAAANDMDGIVTTMFGAQVVALEVLGVLLTAVMIGALVIARPVGMPDDATNYGHITRRDVEESQAASDPSHIKDGPIHHRPSAPAAAPAAAPFAEVGK